MSILITVLASGRGSNFKALHAAIKSKTIKNATINNLILDRANTGAEEYAKLNQIPNLIIDYKSFKDRKDFNKELLDSIQKQSPDLILCLGFMRILPSSIISAYPQKIINIHPSLLPSFPGMNAQKQAFDYGVKISGCTVHFIDDGIDTGKIIEQSAVCISKCRNANEVGNLILEEEHKLIVDVIKGIVKNYVKK